MTPSSSRSTHSSVTTRCWRYRCASWGELAGSPRRRSPREWSRPLMAVVEEAAAALAAEQAGVDHPEQEGYRGVQRFLELLVHCFGDRLDGVQPDEIRKVQRPHR